MIGRKRETLRWRGPRRNLAFVVAPPPKKEVLPMEIWVKMIVKQVLFCRDITPAGERMEPEPKRIGPERRIKETKARGK